MNEIKELWVVVINKEKYELDTKQAMVLNEAISKGNRGIIQFDGFIINIPFIQEFYLVRQWESLNTPIMLAEPENTAPIPLTKEQVEKKKKEDEAYKEWLVKEVELKKKIARNILGWNMPEPKNRLSSKEFDERRAALLEQAKRL